jgi:hypothetical protein
MNDKVNPEIAKAEVEKWLDYKKVSQNKKESYADNIKALEEAIVEGYLSLDDNFNFVQQLKFPIESEVSTSVLTFKPRLKESQVSLHLTGVKIGDFDGRLYAYVAALTGKPKDLIKALDTEDYSIGKNIAFFFI